MAQVSPRDVSTVCTTDAGIAEEAGALGIRTFGGDVNAVEFARGEVGFSVHYPRILRPHLIEGYRKIYNLHPGYLPWGRGFYPVFWALWEQTPAGATLHEITAGVDQGPVVAQTRVEYYAHDTGGSLHARVREAEKKLFLDYWPKVIGGERLAAAPQPARGGSYHTRKEFFDLKERPALESLSGTELLHLIRCLTFPGFPGLEVSVGGRRFEVRLEERAPAGAGGAGPAPDVERRAD